MASGLDMAYEIEEKFALSDSTTVESRLKELGFVPSKQVEFVDWYFDTEKNELSLNDCWLRFRGKSIVDGTWELKLGHGDSTTDTTVYEEIVGEDALSVAKTILVEKNGYVISQQRADRGNSVEAPPLPEDAHDLLLAPFCRLETRRSSWQLDAKWPTRTHTGLSVDLDVTNSGYSVGEVEMVVDEQDGIMDGRRKVRKLIAELIEGSAPCEGPATGKLEQFLMTHRPDHYEACLEAGVIKRR